jgi:hypothetical protein
MLHHLSSCGTGIELQIKYNGIINWLIWCIQKLELLFITSYKKSHSKYTLSRAPCTYKKHIAYLPDDCVLRSRRRTLSHESGGLNAQLIGITIDLYKE